MNFYFALLFSCWTRAMQNHNAKVGLSSLKSILQRLPFPMILSFLPVRKSSPSHVWVIARPPHVHRLLSRQTRSSRSSWVLCLFCPSGRLQSSGDVSACSCYKQLWKKWIEYWILPLVPQKWNFSPQLLTVMPFQTLLTFFVLSSLSSVKIQEGQNNPKCSPFGFHWRKYFCLVFQYKYLNLNI